MWNAGLWSCLSEAPHLAPWPVSSQCQPWSFWACFLSNNKASISLILQCAKLHVRHCGDAEINRLRPPPAFKATETWTPGPVHLKEKLGSQCSSNIIFNIDSACVKDLLILIHSLSPSKIYLTVHILLPSPHPHFWSVRKHTSGCLLMIDGPALSLYLLACRLRSQIVSKWPEAVSMW